MRFRPMPGLTLALLICLPILIGLGVWQYQRWQWKTGVLAEVEASVSAEPLVGLAELDAAIRAGEPLDFRRIQIAGGKARGQTYHYYRPQGRIQWQPFRRVREMGRTVLVGFPIIDDAKKAEIGAPEIAVPAAGYVRRIRPRRGFAEWTGADHNPVENRWFDINPDGAWLDGARVWIDVSDGGDDAGALPVRYPEIANNHVSYMLTWWSFAVIFIIIYLMLHRRAGRLSRQ